ncbi:TetR/AcrR family transcriptional regulator [Nocardiopsis protaetiae]|uniref:TetR/AcrR family transcriptional regulator n=1 Tax=Nocardiopsis protaetiae TaxID=3382270 RepID=UPI00387A9856
MPPKQKRGEATVERLLAAALELYASPGRRSFTVNAVTDAGDASLGSLYHHFGSFEGLTVALYLRWLERLCDRMHEAVFSARDARQGVRALVEAYLRFTVENPDAAFLLHTFAASGLDEEHVRRIRRAKDERLAGIMAWVRERVEAGEIAPMPGPMIEALAIGPVAEVARRWASDTYDVDLAEAERVLPDRIWRSLRPDPE